jgi:hypothetical protein
MDLEAALDELTTSDHFVSSAYRLVEEWEHAKVGREAVKPVLKFTESNPALDLGTPGPPGSGPWLRGRE